MGKLEHFVGCHFITSKDKSTVWIHHPRLSKHLENSFKDLIKTERVFKTPRTVIMRPGPDNPKISSTDQKKYRSGVGILLYLIKYKDQP
jgi:hypothetical protein